MQSHVEVSLRKQQEWCFQCLEPLLPQVYLSHRMPQRRRLSIVKAIVQDYAPLAQVVARENAKVARAVVRTAVRPPVEAVVDRVVKDVVMQCVKAIVLLAVKLHVIASVVMHA